MSQQAAPGKPRGSVRLRLASLGILSGLLVGILMGIAARIAMRIVALLVDQGLEFTVAGTLGIILMVSFASVLLGLIFVAVRKYLPGAGLLKGLAFSGLVFFFIGIPFLLGLFLERALARGNELRLHAANFRFGSTSRSHPLRSPQRRWK